MKQWFRLTPKSVYKRLYKDQQGIMRRYIREKANWDAHLERTKSYILRHLSGDNNDTLAILGSGWLLDVPLDALRERFKTIYLLDIKHPEQIKRKYANTPGVEFITTDITGGAVNGVQQVLKRKNSLQNINFDSKAILEYFPKNPDVWISVNILNQLDNLLVDQLKRAGINTSEAIMEFRMRVQQDHFDFLQNRQSILIADYLEQQLGDNENVLNEKMLVHVPFPPGKKQEEWTWKFDTQKLYHPDRLTNFKVLARCFGV